MNDIVTNACTRPKSLRFRSGYSLLFPDKTGEFKKCWPFFLTSCSVQKSIHQLIILMIFFFLCRKEILLLFQSPALEHKSTIGIFTEYSSKAANLLYIIKYTVCKFFFKKGLYYLSFHPTGLEEKKICGYYYFNKRHKGMSPILF